MSLPRESDGLITERIVASLLQGSRQHTKRTFRNQ